MAQPLRWCVDWHNLNFKDRFLLWLPLFGTDEKAYRDIVRQLSERTEKDLAESAHAKIMKEPLITRG